MLHSLQGREQEIDEIIGGLKESLTLRERFSVYHIFAARDDLLRISKASHKNPKITSVLKTLLIGQVAASCCCFSLPNLSVNNLPYLYIT